MKKTILFIFVVSVAVFLVLGIAYFASRNTAEVKHIENDNSTQDQGVIFPDLEVGESIQQDGYTIERLPDAPQEPVKAPSLNRAIPTSSPHIDESVYGQVVENLDALVSSLKENPDDFITWLNLSIYRTTLSDYVGAEEVLMYLNKRYSPSWQVYSNLGGLYSSYLVDLDKGAVNYAEAINLLPNNPGLYRLLFEVYAKQGKGDQAIATLKSGIKAEPKAIDLHVLLARFLRDEGQTEEASVYYDKAIEQAQLTNNTSLQADLKNERDAL